MHKRAVRASVLAVSVGLMACGGSPSPGESTAEPEAVPEQHQTVPLTEQNVAREAEEFEMDQLRAVRGAAEVRIESAVLRVEPDGARHLFFFVEPAGCPAVRQLPVVHPGLVAVMQTEPAAGGEIAVGPLEPTSWRYRPDGGEPVDHGAEGSVVVRALDGPERVQGHVHLELDELVLDGPFVADVCRVERGY